MKKLGIAVLLVACMVLGIVAGAMAADYPNLPMSVPKVETPVIDGSLNDATWLNASVKGGKYVVDMFNEGTKISEYPRVGYIGYNDDGLYVAFIIIAPDVTKLVGDGSSWWNNDEVEIFLEPNKAGKVHQIGITSTGYISNPAVKAAIIKDGIKWTVEAAIPWSAVGASAPKQGDTWGINLCGRQMAVGDMWVAFNTPFGRFANADRMAIAVFAD